MKLDYVTPSRVAQLLQVEPAAVERWIDDRVLRAITLPDGRRRVHLDSLRAFLVVHTVGFRPGGVDGPGEAA
jgi:predicted site-specific integrase-resolvase